MACDGIVVRQLDIHVPRRYGSKRLWPDRFLGVELIVHYLHAALVQQYSLDLLAKRLRGLLVFVYLLKLVLHINEA
jgi:hypothetical protein